MAARSGRVGAIPPWVGVLLVMSILAISTRHLLQGMLLPPEVRAARAGTARNGGNAGAAGGTNIGGTGGNERLEARARRLMPAGLPDIIPELLKIILMRPGR